MTGISFVICDTETTGLSTKYHEIIEISMIDYSTKQQIFRQIRAHNPKNASFDALRVCKKTMKDLEVGIERNQAVKDINNFLVSVQPSLANICIIGHNISFDRKFLHTLWENVGEKFVPSLWCDTIPMVKEYIATINPNDANIVKTATGRVSTKLGDCCTLLGVQKLVDAHSAVADTRATYFLFRKLMNDCGIDHLPHIKTHNHKFDDEQIINDNVDFDLLEEVE